MDPQEADFLRVLIPRPLANRWARGGFGQEDSDVRELLYWLRAAYTLDAGKQANFETWLAKVLR